MSLYFILDLAAIAIPLAFSFDKRLEFNKTWAALFISMLIVGVLFVAWDSLFVKMGVWGFNADYLSGIYFFRLPLEEYLFFICVPYASVFTFHVFRKQLPGFSIQDKTIRSLVLPLAFILIVTGIIFRSRWYTCTTFLFAGISLMASYYYFKKFLPHFLISFCVILIPFFIMNGILTGSFIKEEVVWYNNSENIGIRIFTIPFEDIFYGLTLILWNVNLTYFLNEKFSKKK